MNTETQTKIDNDNDETLRLRAETRKLNAEAQKLQAEQLKYNAEQLLSVKKLKWYELTIAIAVTIAIIAFSKQFL